MNGGGNLLYDCIKFKICTAAHWVIDCIIVHVNIANFGKNIYDVRLNEVDSGCYHLLVEWFTHGFQDIESKRIKISDSLLSHVKNS